MKCKGSTCIFLKNCFFVQVFVSKIHLLKPTISYINTGKKISMNEMPVPLAIEEVNEESDINRYAPICSANCIKFDALYNNQLISGLCLNQ
jgi:hypothetical protein